MKTVPPEPISSNSDLASAAPTCTEAIRREHEQDRRHRGDNAHVAVTELTTPAAPARERTYEELEAIFARVDAPFALVDLDAMWANGRELLARAQGTPIRVASKSVRCRALLAAILERDPGFRGLMTFTLAESLWLHGHGFRDLLLAYPSADRGALAELAALDAGGAPILMVDSVEHLDLIEAAAGAGPRPLRVCIDLDVGWWPLGGRLKVGAKRSPLRTPEEARALAQEIVRRPRFELAALMGYEAHIAGLGDRPLGKRLQAPLIRLMKRRSAAEIAERRAAVVAAVREVAPVAIVNGGGTGSIHTTRARARRDRDHRRARASSLPRCSTATPTSSSRPRRCSPCRWCAAPAAPRPRCWAAATTPRAPRGATGCPRPTCRAACGSTRRRGPARCRRRFPGAAAASLRIGDRVYLRHAKAGELCERFDSLHLVSGGEIVDEVPTYRGEGRCEL